MPAATPAPLPASASAPRRLTRPELLAPAGDWECARAAVENGADAIYFGLERFNARMRAKNFTQADLPALMEFLHRRGVRGYVTFNTLVFTPELPDAADYLRGIIAAGVDAAIVQDTGVCRLIRQLSPDFPIHGSTQMTVTSAAGVRFARELGAELVVLARENSIAEIERIQQAQAEAGVPPLPLEVFVHGALCVAYSGQCLTSEALGGRSANRGECAQACRLPYDLYADGQKVDLGDRRYLLSPQDLAGLEVLPDLVRAGVASLKIEGRLKSPEYVASITRVYRQALDRTMDALASQAPVPPGPAAERYALEMSFSRGLYTGWFRGIDNQRLAHGRFGTKRGVYLGEVSRVAGEEVTLALHAPLKPGDGVVFDAGNPEQREEGGRVYHVVPRGLETVLRFGQGDVDFRRVQPGNKVWKTSDPALEREVRTTFEGEKVRHTRPLRAEVHGHAGAPLTLLLDDGEGHVARVDSALPLAAAEQQPLDAERLRAQLGRLGGTPFHLRDLVNRLEGAVILPVSELNRLRRDAVAALERQRSAPRRWTLRPEPPRLAPAPIAAPATTPNLPPSPEFRAAQALPGTPAPGKDPVVSPASEAAQRTVTLDPAAGASRAGATASPLAASPPAEPELIATVRDLAQIEPAWAAGVRTVYCEFENPKHYREAVTCFRSLQGAGGTPGSSLWVAPPRVFKPGEEWILRQVRSCDADGYLVRNYDHAAFFAGDRRRGDFSLNIANPLSAELWIRDHGLERVTASYDLNVAQLEALLQAAPPAWFDLTLHQHMPLFHMEHCVFCAFLSTGKDYRDCGRPCDTHRVVLKDRVGAELPLRADAGCRNTVYNNRAQTGAEFASRFVALGARSFRVEFLHEPPEDVRQTLARYQQLLRGEISGADLWRELRLINQLGVTRGQLEAAPQLIRRKT